MRWKRPVYRVYLLIIGIYGYIGYKKLYSNEFALYFIIGSLIFLFSSLTYELANFFYDFAEGDEIHLLSFFQDLSAGLAGGFIVAILSEFKGGSITSVSYWFAIPAAIAVCTLFLVILGIPYIDMEQINRWRRNYLQNQISKGRFRKIR